MTAGELRWVAGAALMLTGWYATRLVAGTRLRTSFALPLDLLLPVVIFALVLLLSARPVLAGIATLAMGAGWARADRDKCRALAEPIVFTDVFQAFDILRYPHLAIPFEHKGRIVLAAIATVGFFVVTVLLEPPAWHATITTVVLSAGIVGTIALLLWQLGPLSYRLFSGLSLTLDPAVDSARHGSLAVILLYQSRAISERASRLAMLARPAPVDAQPGPMPTVAGPVVLVQNESFFDVRRLHPSIDRNLLTHYDRACAEGLQWGRLAVPSWGANTVRTEFAVLTGLDQNATGYDRFNPYFRFVSRPIATLAWRLQSEGYRTICLHPFDRHFYRRHIVLPLLGFTDFIGDEVFEGAERVNGFVSDIEVARTAARLLREHGPKLMLFIITMENHGPWSETSRRDGSDLSALGLESAEQCALNNYIASLVNADQMLGIIRSELESRAEPSVMAFYGDHLPSFPSIFTKVGMTQADSDYLIWRSGGGAGKQRNLAASELAAALLDALRPNARLDHTASIESS